MSSLYLVRHGQASWGSDDYDRLSPLGREQCRHLAAHWRALERPAPWIYSGLLRRQLESATAFAGALGGAATRSVPGLEEYDHEELLRALQRVSPEPFDLAGSRNDRRHFHRLIERALKAWADGRLSEVESYAEFRERCAAALRELMQELGRGQTAVVFGSAGSLAAGIQAILGLGDWDLLRLKLNFYNTGVTRVLFDGSTATVESLNAIPHLERPGLAHLITYR